MKPGRNDPCPCGSGKKYKKCHLALHEEWAGESAHSFERHLMASEIKKNLAFNRLEGTDHHYLSALGGILDTSTGYSGLIKVKLCHSEGKSVIVPDLIFLQTGGQWKWMQPFSFLACSLVKQSSEDITCTLFIDIASGFSIKILINKEGFVRSYHDGAQLYKCQIAGPPNLLEIATGNAKTDERWNFKITLFHHTKNEFRDLIEAGRHFRLSKWNIQGTKELINVGYVYFTCLPKIEKNNDLVQIAMATNGEIILLRDNFDLPATYQREFLDDHPDDVLKITVYRESTLNRTAALEMDIPVETIAPQHIHFHKPTGQAVYYAVCNPFIYRVGRHTNAVLEFEGNEVQGFDGDSAVAKHIVVGDCTKKEGLWAPFDEEETRQIFKIEFFEDNVTFHDFWFSNGNSDLFSDKEIAPYIFRK
jgi:hypothetical protein